MQPLSPTERKMWREPPTESKQGASAEEINQKYAKRELRIVTETNREQLPNFVQAMQREGWLKLQPFYQRRQRWDDKRKSKLIESFIMNIPVPPCFLYESDLARYEVMDGQQRISAIADFYENRFKLKGLEQWPELNGLIYDRLPSEIRRGLDRRSISYIVLLKESANTRDEELLLRQQVFERLNTGGVELENQEVRHCIYHNEFDDLLIELSRHPAMRDAWGLVRYEKEEDENPLKNCLRTLILAKCATSSSCCVVWHFGTQNITVGACSASLTSIWSEVDIFHRMIFNFYMTFLPIRLSSPKQSLAIICFGRGAPRLAVGPRNHK